ncbi:ATP-dependent helicase [Solitalea koreensis]|uniref:DNA 3'-5' helicase n=1 Tax=Solitalea koreensis TaxID=543615 RepID=A0A521E0L3_9SPHI|nr:UvrD-helicase domain-containing protein [Solitalea koreensis]SMO77503.1 DNA helicase-2 / ATP-dependent DNA helicase PcrA [Solitalea koreensis]
MSYLDKLNPTQRAAAECTEGPLMIIAGAGSGKTRVVTYRIAHLIDKGVDPFNILSLTFTNKAAKEMRERITAIAGPDAKNIWMGTFHSIFARILRVEAEKIGYPSNFTIYDTDDSKSLLRAIIKEQQLDDKLYNVNFVLNRISSAKNNLISVAEYKKNEQIQADDFSAGRGKLKDIYEIYAQRCYKAGAMDFDDLLFKTNILLKQHPEVLHKYQHKFKYIMVDEYQDTNFSQYNIVKRLAAVHNNICVVGDDAQSIYAFRGATIQNILNFEKDYPELNIFKLEQNYRSTQNIVNVANSVIKNNKEQLKKDVFSENATGEKIKVLRAFSDNEEGKIIAESIIQERSVHGLNYQDFAILYRTNAQSRSMEESLRKLNIPYKIYGGLSFYQRKEIKDLIGYFRLTVNPNDEEALKRIINYPVRGIGDTTLNKIIAIAGERNLKLWELVSDFHLHVTGRGVEQVMNFATMIRSFQAMLSTHNAYEVAEHIAKQSGLLRELHADKSIEGLSRYENVQELLSGIKEFSEREDIEDRGLGQFLQDVALLTGDENNKDKDDKNTVSLMTIHSSKGLEFPHVFIVGLEENLFPSQMSLSSRQDLEEERRLFYVAITRAERKLTLSYASSRYRWGSLNNCEPSRFLDEVDPRYLDLEFTANKQAATAYSEERVGGKERAEFAAKPKIMAKTTQMLPKAHTPSPDFAASDTSQLQVGMEVEHERFGFGKVINLEGNKPDIKATIFFKELGQKQLLLKFAKLRIC